MYMHVKFKGKIDKDYKQSMAKQSRIQNILCHLQWLVRASTDISLKLRKWFGGNNRLCGFGENKDRCEQTIIIMYLLLAARANVTYVI